MQGKNTEQRKTPWFSHWSILITIIIICLSVASGAIILRVTNKHTPTTGGTIMQKKAQQDLYIGYEDVMYRISGRDGSVIWNHPLQQPSKMNRIIGSSMQVHMMNDGLICVVLEHTFYILRSSDGKELWHYAVILTPAQQAETRASIMDVFFDKERVYVDFSSGEIAAMDIQTGSLKWKETRFPNGASFTANDGTLYAKASTATGESILYAFDGATGKERWHFTREMWGNTEFSPSIVINGILYDGGNPLYALDARTGKKLWEQRLPDRSRYFGNLHLIDGVLYANTSAVIATVGSVGGAGEQIPPDIYRVYAFDVQTGHPLWHSQDGYQMLDGGAITNGLIMAQSAIPEQNQQEKFAALDIKNGAVRWQIALANPPCDGAEICGPHQVQIAGQRLYALDYSHLQVFDMSNGKRLAQYAVALPAKKSFGPGVLNNGIFYVRSAIHEGGAYSSGSSNTFWQYTIHAFRLTDGKAVWAYNVGKLREYQDPISEMYIA
ncbi:MAG: PQQ-like beta-propeller repeat protein [Ktedonobacteraceae bacterium]|nr:PQQ-like beta-propeller repeat protein [Ktedonobacteraceae bacterium]